MPAITSSHGILFTAFDKLTVLIVGDVMVDSYLWGKVTRLIAGSAGTHCKCN